MNFDVFPNLKSIKLGKMAREDLMWWSNFCESFNGKRKIEYLEYPYPIVSDSSMKGFAIYKKTRIGLQALGMEKLI